MSFEQIAIRVLNVSKRYEVYRAPLDRLRQFVLPRIKFRRQEGAPHNYFSEFWALQNVSFEIRRGETIGVIGRNGSGKSTLLQMICGTLSPTGGEIETRGRVAALLELGSGFNPEFTGRENVYLNAAILGLGKEEIENRFSDIESFADIGDFLDQPVRTYSSGMLARLAFSVAVQVDPDILVVDEALSVGDMAFQEKSFTRMKKIREAGTSILFVSHSTSAVRNFCDRAIWLDKGNVRAIGERQSVCDSYQAEMERMIRQGKASVQSTTSGKTQASIFKPKARTIAIESVVADKQTYNMGDEIRIEIKLRFFSVPPAYGVGLIIYDADEKVVTIFSTLRDDIFLSQANTNVSLVIRNNNFVPGAYRAALSVSDEHGMFSYDKLESCFKFDIKMERSMRGLAKVDGVLRSDHEWSDHASWQLNSSERLWLRPGLPAKADHRVPLLVLLRVRNEALVLQDTLDHLSAFADYICVYEDASDDASRELLKSCEKVVLMVENDQWQTGIDNRLLSETRHRGLLLEMARRYFEFSWCMCCDADERYIGGLREYVTSPLELKPEAVRVQLFDAYMTRGDDAPYRSGAPLLNFRRLFGVERRDILMLWQNRDTVRFAGLDAREPVVKGRIDVNFFCQHYGKSLSYEHWDATCDYYSTHFPWVPYGEKWSKRKGQALHERSDFGRELLAWSGALFENSIKIN
ncbi:ATP-binding cassette domain-containing protein [Pseudomonas gingeri]|uniref:ATP-binding cassette domain-containing protein n=2 Tax=Pseudomonas gingeri TaxID=117681 RepID=A0A7Y7YJ30_9PSED|nr:ATP-binding cassette domain-containing protein [Pseudomonas gingeri]NWC37000.1 ATP-binding cassette domain-containing protein [Pseudomonas gingeri]